MSDAYLEARSDYNRGDLDLSEFDGEPHELLRAWIAEAGAAGHPEPNAMALATSTADAHPSVRIVLLRGLTALGLEFFTNYESRKGRELEANPAASVCFWWPDLQRQVRVEGTIAQVSPEESDAYFQSRPLESRLASAVSPQSQAIASREELEKAMETMRQGPISRPEHWGGYRLSPVRWEFWQGRRARLHDRFELRQDPDGHWRASRLAP